jgi:hypothetical protein
MRKPHKKGVRGYTRLLLALTPAWAGRINFTDNFAPTVLRLELHGERAGHRRRLLWAKSE